MSDKGREWKHRAPPRGVGSESYTLCRQFMSEGHCRFGAQCVEAHNKEELKEWKERFEYRKNKAQKAAKLYGKSFVDVVLDKLSAAKSQIDTVSQLNRGPCSTLKPSLSSLPGCPLEDLGNRLHLLQRP